MSFQIFCRQLIVGAVDLLTVKLLEQSTEEDDEAAGTQSLHNSFVCRNGRMTNYDEYTNTLDNIFKTEEKMSQ